MYRGQRTNRPTSRGGGSDCPIPNVLGFFSNNGFAVDFFSIAFLAAAPGMGAGFLPLGAMAIALSNGVRFPRPDAGRARGGEGGRGGGART